MSSKSCLLEIVEIGKPGTAENKKIEQPKVADLICDTRRGWENVKKERELKNVTVIPFTHAAIDSIDSFLTRRQYYLICEVKAKK